jgi:hypothetical protein
MEKWSKKRDVMVYCNNGEKIATPFATKLAPIPISQVSPYLLLWSEK